MESLIENGGFEADELGMLSMWATDAWIDTDAAVRYFATEQAKHAGERCFAIANLQPNDARGIQWVSVKPDTLYRLSAWVMARNVETEGIGANISVLGSTCAAGDLKDTGSEWRYVELYGRTGPEQQALAVLVRLGFYGSLAKGIALFDDVRLEELAALPAGAKAISFSANEAAEVFPVVTSGEPLRPSRTTVPSGAMPWVVLLVLAALAAATSIVAGVALAVLVRSRRSPSSATRPPSRWPGGKLTIESLIAGDRTGQAWRPVSAWSFLKPSLRGKKRRGDSRLVEHRGSSRTPLAAHVTVRARPRLGSTGEFQLQTEDISDTGLFVRASDLFSLKLDEEVALLAGHGTEASALGRAVVTRVHAQVDGKGRTVRGGFGLRFLAVDARAHRVLKNLAQRR